MILCQSFGHKDPFKKGPFIIIKIHNNISYYFGYMEFKMLDYKKFRSVFYERNNNKILGTVLWSVS